jgi:hypothetical protein
VGSEIISEVMMKRVSALTFATLVLLAATPVLAQNPVEPTPSDQPPVVMPNDPNAPPTIVVVPAPEPRKNTGALDPDTPDPTRNTPGAETKN